MLRPYKVGNLDGDVGGHGYDLGAGWLQGGAGLVALVFQGGAYEGGEERVRL